MDHGLVRNVPVLTGRSLPPMISLWERLGLQLTAEFDGEYAILATREAYDPDSDTSGDGPGAVEVHLSAYPEHDPYTTAGSVYLRVRDAQALYDRLRAELEAEGLLYLAPAGGISEEHTAVLRAMDADGVAYLRLHVIETKPWGTHEFAVVDPEGNLVRIGTVVG